MDWSRLDIKSFVPSTFSCMAAANASARAAHRDPGQSAPRVDGLLPGVLTVAPIVMTMSGMRTKKIEVRVEPEELAAFVAAAKSEGLSLSAWIRRLLLLQLKKPGSQGNADENRRLDIRLQ
jgi:hypothetical protein